MSTVYMKVEFLPLLIRGDVIKPEAGPAQAFTPQGEPTCWLPIPWCGAWQGRQKTTVKGGVVAAVLFLLDFCFWVIHLCIELAACV